MNRFTIELAGVPASGKTTAARRLHARFLREGREAVIVREAAEIAPFPRSQKRDWRFNAWTLFYATSEMIRLEADPAGPTVIFDRGLFDAAVWIRWHLSSKHIDPRTASLLQSVCLFEPWQRQVDVVFLLEASFDVVLERRSGRVGQIVNRETLRELADAYESIRIDPGSNLTMPLFVIPTDHRSPEDVERAILAHLDEVVSKRPGVTGDNDSL